MSCRNYEEEILYLRAQLADSNEELNSVNDQLNCLVVLVKRALSGDQDAMSHLRIICAIDKDSTSKEEQLDPGNTSTSKVKAMKNWAIMTSSLLCKDYQDQTKTLKQESLYQLTQRAAYLDDVQSSHYSEMKHSYLAGKSGPSNNLIKPSRIQSGNVRRKRNSPENGGLKAEDFFSCSGDQSNVAQKEAMAALQKTNRAESSQKMTTDYSSYDDPHRYEQPGLFDHKSFIKNTERPVSSKSLQDGDSRRARPKSSIISERPLKYETTRPVSGSKKTVETTKPTSAKGRNSAKQKSTEAIKETKSFSNTDPIHGFTDELKRMNDMENQFKMTALSLQKKIGIRPDGFIAP